MTTTPEHPCPVCQHESINTPSAAGKNTYTCNSPNCGEVWLDDERHLNMMYRRRQPVPSGWTDAGSFYWRINDHGNIELRDVRGVADVHVAEGSGWIRAEHVLAWAAAITLHRSNNAPRQGPTLTRSLQPVVMRNG